jgi:DNA-binding transcriptional LysR family regulator
MALSNVDANLLYPLYVLLEEAHVERAAKRLCRSPSATSHILSRLRDGLGDPLLVRKGRVLVRSARGEALRPILRRLVSDMEQVFATAGGLDLPSLERTFRIAVTDGVDAGLLAGVCQELAKSAPNVSLVLSSVDSGTLDRLRRAEIDLAFYSLRNVPAGFHYRPLFTDRFVTLLRDKHPAAKGKLTLERFVSLPHVLVSPAAEQRGIVDRLLSERGLSRRISLVAPTFASGLLFVAHTDHITTVPRRMVELLIGPLQLVEREPPLELPSAEVLLVWSDMTDADPAHRVIRELIGKERGGA